MVFTSSYDYDTFISMFRFIHRWLYASSNSNNGYGGKVAKKEKLQQAETVKAGYLT